MNIDWDFNLFVAATTNEVHLTPTATSPDNVYAPQALAQWDYRVGGAVPRGNIDVNMKFLGTATVTPPAGHQWTILTDTNTIQPVFDSLQFNAWLLSLRPQDWK